VDLTVRVDRLAVNLSPSIKPPTKFWATYFVRLKAKTEKPRKVRLTRVLCLQAKRRIKPTKRPKSQKRPKRRRKRKRKKKKTGINRRRNRRNLQGYLKERPDLCHPLQNQEAFSLL